jgi:hypothetical protein
MALLIALLRRAATIWQGLRAPRLASATLLCWASSLALAQTTPEYQIKAVFLFNFTQFVEWPSEAFPDDETPLVIAVLGSDPFGTFLDEIVRGEMAQGRRLVVERYADVRDVGLCHVLFIGRSEAARVRQVLDRVKHRKALTVSDIEGFAGSGGVISFISVAGRIRLRVNLDTAREAQLTLSSKLLRAAQIVRSRQE